MDVRFHAPDDEQCRALASHVERLLRRRLMARRECIRFVDVRVGSARGETGRHDAWCLLRLQLIGAPPATVIDIGSNAFVTIHRAVDRLSRVAAAASSRMRDDAVRSGRAAA